jgi:glycosyltransferase involved in cell wall biosynthesis
MIVKNEEEFLGRCLESVKEVVDEIIIVDTGSTDSTVSIANKYNAKVYSFEWIGNFSAARNYSIKQATSDYILILDADEYLDSNVQLLLDQISSGKDFYILSIKNYLDYHIFNHQAIRVFKRNKGFTYKNKIHEHINIDDFVGLTQETIDFWIHHTGYTGKLYTDRNKHERNLELLLTEVQNNPSGYTYLNLGNQYKSHGEYEKALDAFKQAFYLSKDRVYLSFLLDQIGKCLLLLNRFEEGIAVISDSIEGFPGYTNLHFTLGELYVENGDLIDAESSFFKCLELGEVTDQQTLVGIGGYLSHFNLMKIYDRKGDLPKALEECYHSLSQNRTFTPTLMYLLKLLIKGNVPWDEQRKFIDNCFSITNQLDLNNLLICLFKIRSPLLLHYIDQYHAQVEPAIRTVALQYAKRDIEALNEWKSVDSVTKELTEDIFALSLKLNSFNLLPIMEGHFSQNEYLLLKEFMIKNEQIELSKNLQDVIEKVIPKCALLGDFETVKYLLNILTEKSSKEFPTLMRELFEYGFKDVVIEYISNYLNNGISDEYLEILGDLYTVHGPLSNALMLYTQLLELNPKYSIYEKTYLVYKRLGDRVGMEQVENEIKAKFPQVKWVKNVASIF